MKATTRKSARATEAQEAIAELKKLLKPGSTVYTVLRHVSASGMSRSIDLLIVQKGEIRRISYTAAKAMGYSLDDKNGGLKTQGCGMDMGFNLVYNLGRTLFPKGFVPAKAGHNYGRNGTDKNAVDTDGGYALTQRWL